MFTSTAYSLGVIPFPSFTGLRVMMMPFRLDDMHTLSRDQIGGWRDTVQEALRHYSAVRGIGYLTIDEAEVEPGQTHRRPGLHVDGYSSYGGGPSPYAAIPYGGGGGYAHNGMILAANVCGTRAWIKDFEGSVLAEGNCEHLREQCSDEDAVVFGECEAWWCSPLCVHEGVPVKAKTHRQLLRVSFPSDAPYHWPYTPNQTGVVPITPPGPDRSAFMAYRQD